MTKLWTFGKFFKSIEKNLVLKQTVDKVGIQINPNL